MPPKTWKQKRDQLLAKAKAVPLDPAVQEWCQTQGVKEGALPPGGGGATPEATERREGAPPTNFRETPQVGVGLTAPASIQMSDGALVRLGGRPPSRTTAMTIQGLQERNEAKAALALEIGIQRLMDLLDSEDPDVVIRATSELNKIGGRKQKVGRPSQSTLITQSKSDSDQNIEDLESLASGDA